MQINRDSLKQLFRDADKGGYAIPAFNYSDIWDLKAIVEAANIERAPVMVAANPLVFRQLGPELCAGIGKGILGQAKYPVFHHLDHSNETDLCKKAVALGFPSVMMDGSAFSLEENIRMVSEVVHTAHPANVHVEAEIGKIKGKGCIEGGAMDNEDYLADPEEARALVEASGADSLAVGIGTAHGFYQGKPELNFKRLAEINEIVDVPLVLHGGSGIPEEDVRHAIKNGINKVNVGTYVHCTYMNSLARELQRVGPDPYTLDVMKPVMKDVVAFVRGAIQMCMADGKAVKYF